MTDNKTTPPSTEPQFDGFDSSNPYKPSNTSLNAQDSEHMPLPGPSGVGGWLLFLIISMAILTPLVDVVQTLGAIETTTKTYPELKTSPVWAQYEIYCWVMLLITNSLRIGGGLLLAFTKKKSSVKWAIASLWVSGPIAVLIFSQIVYMALNFNLLQHMGIGILQTCFYATIWTWYLKSSKRVKNTYVDKEEPSFPRHEIG